MGHDIAEFTVSLNKPAFFAGEKLSGQVRLVTTAPIKCRSVQLRIYGKARAAFWTGAGDSRELRDHNFFYWREQLTLWGPYYRTDELEGAGANAIFGSPWAPNEGVLEMPLADPSRAHVLRVMDEDWPMRDDLLGEALFAPYDLLDKGEVTLALRRKGNELPSTVTLIAEIVGAGKAPAELPYPTAFSAEARALLTPRRADQGPAAAAHPARATAPQRRLVLEERRVRPGLRGPRGGGDAEHEPRAAGAES